MVIGHGDNADVLQETINVLDNKNIDFFIHWDKKFKKPNLLSHDSHIYFIKSLNVGWGTDSLMIVELKLLSAVNKANRYKMAHLISSADMPLMDSKYFIDYFDGQKSYLGFSDDNTKKFNKRLSYYWPKFSLRNKRILTKLILAYNRLFHINRLKNKDITLKKGPQWFSINTNLIPEILDFDKNPFFNTYCVDEIFIQTILSRFSPKKIVENDNVQAARYIDWNRGKPYTFSLKDVDELKKVKNTNFAFTRKVCDPTVVKKVFNY